MKIIGVLRRARIWITGAALILCFWGIGKQYIRGADRSHLVLMAVENNRAAQQAGEERYTAELVNKQGESLQSFSVDVNRSQNGRRVDLSLGEAIPADALEKGVYLRLSYPLSANGSAVRLEQPNLSGDGEAMRLKSRQAALAIGGMRYQYDVGLSEFKRPLACLLYRSVEEREDGRFTANLYMSPENAEFFTQFPEEKTVERTVLTSLKKLGEAGGSGDGVEVEYSYTTRFQAEALGSSGNSLELQCRIRLRYPTLIRLTESDKVESTQDVSLVFQTSAAPESRVYASESRTVTRSETLAESETPAESTTVAESTAEASTEKLRKAASRRRETRSAARRKRTAAETTQQTAETRPKPEESAAASSEGERESEESSETRESERQTVRRITKSGSGRGRGGSGGRNETSPTDTLPAETKESVPESKPETAAETSEFSKPETTAESSRESTAPSESTKWETETETAWVTQPDFPPNIPTDVPLPDSTDPTSPYPSTGEWWFNPNTGGSVTPDTDWIH